MQGFVLFALFIGVGFHKLCQQYPLLQSFSAVLGIAVVGIQIGITLPTVVPLTINNTYLEDYARSQLNVLPPKSIYIAFGDYQQNSMLYLHEVCKERPDVTIVYLPYASYMWFNNTQLPLYDSVQWPGTVYHPYGSVLKGKDGNAFNIIEFINANLEHSRLFITSWLEPKDKLFDQYSLWPVGLLYEVGIFVFCFY